MCGVGMKAFWSCGIDTRSFMQSGNVILSVTPPADAPVGRYSLSVELGTGSAVKESLVVLFNPWCKEDWVYLPDEKERQEYVMNEHGIIYRGTAHSFGPMHWEFGQFEEEMVDICLELLDLNPKHKRDPDDDVSARCNPIYISRVISAMINSNDDMGVLVGRWDNNYQDGTCPTRWLSSVRILQQWYKNSCRAVKYGQCWVFAGVMCTVMRFFGIPCRVVTNFESAHDTNSSLTIDEYFDDYGLKPMGGSDSIWNFHVWVEGWMTRPDLNKGGRYDGWQVLDPTPQERSDGVFCCGPAPVFAVLQGDTNLKYDVPFVFSEVNADIVKWMIKADGTKKRMKYLTNTSRVGQNISTKAVGSFNRLDITDTYKYCEGSAIERVAYDNAVRRVNSQDGSALHGTCEVIEVQMVEMSLEEEKYYRNSQDIKLNLKLSNRDRDMKTLSISLNAQATNYTRTQAQNILHNQFVKNLPPGQVVNIPILIPYSAYCKYAVTHDSMKVSVNACDSEGEFYQTDTNLALEDPPISIKEVNIEMKTVCLLQVLGEARVNQPMTIVVEFENPLNETLRSCFLTVTGSGIFRNEHIESNERALPANGTLKLIITTTPYRAGLRTIVADFDCSAFKDIKASCIVEVKP
ncbi:protein-glutamine gamma-glutamyltransferase 2-like [Anableps anableps]